MLESVIEKTVCDFAKERGFLVYKFTSSNRAAVPDRVFIHPNGEVFFVEFKATGKRATVPQEREHARLRGHNAVVFVIDSIESGKETVDLCMGGWLIRK